MPREHDYAGDAVAVQNRAGKAKALAAWCWDRGITAADVGAWDARIRSRAARSAGVNPPSCRDGRWATWEDAQALLEEMTGWAARRPDHPRAVQPLLAERAEWVPAPS